MRNTLKASIMVLVLGFFLGLPALSYARGHSHVDLNFSFWPWGPYYHDYVYYEPYPYYVVYQQPVVYQEPVTVYQPATTVVQSSPAPAPVTAEGSDFTVNIPNSRGGYTVVTLKRSGTGFTGPQGEFYPEFPKVEQLKVMYGQ